MVIWTKVTSVDLNRSGIIKSVLENELVQLGIKCNVINGEEEVQELLSDFRLEQIYCSGKSWERGISGESHSFHFEHVQIKMPSRYSRRATETALKCGPRQERVWKKW